MDKWDGILAALAIIFSLALVIGAGMFQATPSKVVNVTITISEKYATFTTQGYKSSYTTPAKVVDADGNLYIVQDENLWAKMKVNGTYNVQYAIYPNNYEKQIIGFT